MVDKIKPKDVLFGIDIGSKEGDSDCMCAIEKKGDKLIVKRIAYRQSDKEHIKKLEKIRYDKSIMNYKDAEDFAKELLEESENEK